MRYSGVERMMWGVWLLGLAAMIGVLGWAVAAAGIDARLHARCLAAGYPAAYVTWQLQGYCIRRANHTDEVVPAEQVR